MKQQSKQQPPQQSKQQTQQTKQQKQQQKQQKQQQKPNEPIAFVMTENKCLYYVFPDKQVGTVYYYNPETNHAVWFPPDECGKINAALHRQNMTLMEQQFFKKFLKQIE